LRPEWYEWGFRVVIHDDLVFLRSERQKWERKQGEEVETHRFESFGDGQQQLADTY
jgi:hypothetical protein